MANDLDVRGITLPAAADLTSKLFYAGVVNSSGQVAVQTTAGARVDGVIYSDTPGAGLPVEFITYGAAVKIAAGAALAAGDSLEIDATGRAITATGTAGHVKFGVALVAATAAGEIITYLPRHQA